MILGPIPATVIGGPTPTPTGFIDGSPIAIPAPVGIAGSIGGPIATPSATTLPDGLVSRPLRAFADFFYFRVWVIPPVLDVQNPKLNTDIPFQLWNAFLTDNEVQAIVETDADGITIDAAVTDVFKALEIRTYNAQIDETAPIQIDANFAFDFEYGEAGLRFLALLADILPIKPNSGIVERLKWLTDVLRHRNGTEQRIALRKRPRRSFDFDLSLLNDRDRKAIIDKLYKTVALNVIAPSYQYQSILKQKAAAGDNRIYTNTKRADLRPGEKVLIATREGVFYLYTIDEVFETYATITTAFADDIAKNSIVAAGLAGRIPDKSGLSMKAIEGSSRITIDLIEPREQVAYPEAYSLPTFNGLPLVDRVARADGETGEFLNAGVEVIDNETGKPQYHTPWNQPYVEGRRAFLCQTLFNPDELEFWRNLFDYCCGQQRPFYLPTYRNDLYQFEGTELLPGQVIVEGTEYDNLYFESETYRQLQIETSAGTFEVKVSNVENNGDSATLNFAEAIPADLTNVEVYRISFLLLVRLGTDEVTLTHNHTYSIVEFDIRADDNANV